MDLAAKHLRLGWWMLFFFAALGLTLEGLHAFKVPIYLNADQSVRRLMWTLAHAHGAALGIINIALGVSLATDRMTLSRPKLGSWCLIGASVLVPFGFFLGGLRTHGGDPSIGALLVPPGGVLLLIALALAAAGIKRV